MMKLLAATSVLAIMTAAGFFRPAAVTGPQVTFIGRTINTSDLSSYTFSNVDIGAASSDRLVVVGVATESNGFNRVIQSCTIGGSAATLVIREPSSGAPNQTALFQRLVTTGTTANIVVNLDGAPNNCSIVVWLLTGLASNTATASNSDDGVSADPSCTLTIQAGGVAVYIACTTSSSTSTTPVGLSVEDVDAGGQENCWVSAAHDSFATLQTNRTITANFGVTANTKICAAAWK